MIDLLKKNYHNIVFIVVKKKLDSGQTALNIRGSGLLLKGKKLVTCAHIYNEVPPESRNSFFAGIGERTGEKIKNYNSFAVELLRKNDERDIAVTLNYTKQ